MAPVRRVIEQAERPEVAVAEIRCRARQHGDERGLAKTFRNGDDDIEEECRTQDAALAKTLPPVRIRQNNADASRRQECVEQHHEIAKAGEKKFGCEAEAEAEELECQKRAGCRPFRSRAGFAMAEHVCGETPENRRGWQDEV